MVFVQEHSDYIYICLSKCHLDFNIFVDKVHACYRTGLDDGRDIRNLSGLYFTLWLGIFLFSGLSSVIVKNVNMFLYSVGSVFLVTALTIALIKPYYKKACANYAVTLILSNLALLSFVPSALVSTVIPRILLLTPIVIIIVVSLVYVVSKLMRSIKVPSQLYCHNCCRLRRAPLNTGPTSTVGALAAAEALIQPTCNVISYGTHDA